jgi:hypothetical protein
MKTKAATTSETNGDCGELAAFLRASLKELTAIHRANKAADAEIRKLQSSTRKKLDRIWENLRYVQATG